ncbi:sigma-54 interaction domain-containing protein [Metabacillus herbersteinensis]|uniref:HTH-type transcriptional regulatory protein TyrR n=1 Tax=Metabacillus herbersteinensis TaxID=283816 RepID=A0ABV6GJL1_9BACI
MISLETLREMPFCSIIVNARGIIISLSGLSDQKLSEKIKIGMLIQNGFEKWETEKHSKIVRAQVDSMHYLFLREILCTSNEDQFVFIGVKTSEIFEMQNEMKELEKLNRELDAIIENSYDGIYITDNKGVTLKTNSAIERITGIPKDYYIGKNVDALIERGILKNSVTYKVVKQKRTVSLVQYNYAGKETLITGNPVFNEEGEIEKVVTNIRDLSDLNELQAQLRKANELNTKYKQELDRLKSKPNQTEGIVIHSEQMRIIYDTAERIAHVDATVLILGDTGVGKDVLAKHIFQKSPRSKEGEFIKVNCGAIPPDLLESELFGYEGGAFTGANRKGKPGIFEMADKGILFLDEIGELPLSLQVKLLRVIQEKEIQRIGGTKPIKVDVRLIAATNRNLKEMVMNGSFREDLFYRLNVIPIVIPSLKERRDDVLPLLQLFLNIMNTRYSLNKELDAKLIEFLFSFDWPGNIRELSNLVERLVLTSPTNTIRIEDLPVEYRETGDIPHFAASSIVSLKDAVEMAEENVLALALKKYKNTYDLAKALDTSQPTIVRKLKKYNLKTEQHS